MLRQTVTALILVTALGTGVATADTLIIEGIKADTANSPSRGMTRTAVESGWGQPVSRKEAVGNPPISSYEYSNFVVYFEYDRVIHSVAKR